MTQIIRSRRAKTAPRTALLSVLLLVATCALAQRQRRPDAGVIDYALGQRYERENNLFFAEEAYEKSGSAGFAKAYIALARLYESGRAGVITGPNDTAQAYYEKAAALGDDEARAKVEEYSRMPAVPKQLDFEPKLSSPGAGGPTIGLGTFRPGGATTLPDKGAETNHAAPQPPPLAPPERRPPSSRGNFDAASLFVDDRFELIAPEPHAVLAEEYMVRLHWTGPAPKQLFVTQQTSSKYGSVHQGNQEPKLTITSPGEGTFRVLLYALGPVKVDLIGFTLDSKAFRKTLSLQVEPPAVGPTSIFFRYALERRFSGQKLGVIRMTISPKARGTDLTLSAVFDGVIEPLPVEPSSTRYTLRSSGGAQVIELDETTGRVQPLQPGHALVEAAYGGLTKLACFVVTAEPVFLRDHTDCSDLLAPGEASQDFR